MRSVMLATSPRTEDLVTAAIERDARHAVIDVLCSLAPLGLWAWEVAEAARRAYTEGAEEIDDLADRLVTRTLRPTPPSPYERFGPPR